MSGREPDGDGAPAAAQARRLLFDAATAALATAARTRGGWPYASLVLLAADDDAAPLMMLSDLAEHSRNIADDDRVSLLIDGTAGLDEPLDGPRLTLIGRAAATAAPRLRARFLARHPGAARYADFADFRVYRVAVDSAHLVAGFGRIHRLAGAELAADGAPRAVANPRLPRPRK